MSNSVSLLQMVYTIISIFGVILGACFTIYKMGARYTDKAISSLEDKVETEVSNIKENMSDIKDAQYASVKDLKVEMRELRSEISNLRADNHAQNQRMIELLNKIVTSFGST